MAGNPGNGKTLGLHIDTADAKIAHTMLARLRESRREYMKTRYWALKRMADAGLTCREIEKRTGIPKSTVSYVLNNPESWYAEDTTIREENIVVSVRRPGPGPQGMHVPDTSSYVRVTHRPTGLYAESDSERSQLQNKAKALLSLSGLIELVERSRHDTPRTG